MELIQGNLEKAKTYLESIWFQIVEILDHNFKVKADNWKNDTEKQQALIDLPPIDFRINVSQQLYKVGKYKDVVKISLTVIEEDGEGERVDLYLLLA